MVDLYKCLSWSWKYWKKQNGMRGCFVVSNFFLFWWEKCILKMLLSCGCCLRSKCKSFQCSCNFFWILQVYVVEMFFGVGVVVYFGIWMVVQFGYFVQCVIFFWGIWIYFEFRNGIVLYIYGFYVEIVCYVYQICIVGKQCVCLGENIG